MALQENNLTRKLLKGLFGLSARRLWEHTQHRQINPFQTINLDNVITPQAFVDVVSLTGPTPKYLGATLQDFCNDPLQWVSAEFITELLANIRTVEIDSWLREVGQHLRDTCKRRAVRNAPVPFLRSGLGYSLAIPGLRCGLAEWMAQHGDDKARPHQWLNRIQNLTGKGLRQEEVDISRIKDVLAKVEPSGTIEGKWICSKLDYSELQISIIPAVEAANTHLTWRPAPPVEYIKRIKPRIKGKVPSIPQWRDPVLGYWIDMVEWDDLLGPERGWMAFNHKGAPLVSANNPTGFYGAPEDAKCQANHDAGKVLPRLSSKGSWAYYRLTGGENYREWLITLPYFPSTYFSSHYVHRNVLLHVRSDIRESAEGKKVLFLQEIQSDWAQQARRQLKHGDDIDRKTPLPPWLQEWPALALKLMLLHAAEQGFDALAWTTGQEQVERYGGLGEDGLLELYDRTIPREADRILKPFDAKREMIDIFLPVNFSIEPSDSGYEVFDSDNCLIGTASTWRQAQALIPSGAHELLGSMHGITLSKELRRSISEKGFHAWGAGVR